MIALRGLVLAAVVIGGTGVAQAANLIKNGSFETPPTPAGTYTVYSPGQKIGAWVVVGNHIVNTSSTSEVNLGVTLDAKKGQAFMDLTGTCDCGDATTGVAQTVKTVPGTTYLLTFWVGNCYIPGAGTTSTVNVYVGSTLLLAATNTQGQGSSRQVWQKFSKSFVASGSETTLSFLNGDPSGDQQNGLDAVTLAAE